MPHQKSSNILGFAHLLLILLIAIVAIGAVVFYLLTNTKLSQYAPEVIRPFVNTTSNTVPKAEYQNPLEKKSQYENPFEENKNPFDSL